MTKPSDSGKKIIQGVRDGMVKEATSQGIDLAAEFGTPAEFNQWVIAYTIKSLVKGGMSSKDALERIFGEGTYNELFESVAA